MNESTEKPEHNWDHRGINPPTKRFNGWWATLIKTIAVFVLGAVVQAVIWGFTTSATIGTAVGVYKQKFEDIDAWKKETSERINKMDWEGTHSSSWAITQGEKKDAELDARIRRLEETISKIDVLQTKVDAIREDLRSQKK